MYFERSSDRALAGALNNLQFRDYIAALASV
jgi:hypothetical protein